MNDFEVLEKYIKEFNMSDELNELTYPEQILYKCLLRDTLQFNLYLTRYRILEFAKKIRRDVMYELCCKFKRWKR